MMHKSIIAAAALAASAMVPASAIAATTFNFTAGGTNSSNNDGNVRTFVGTDGTKVEVSAYSYGSYLDKSFVGQYSPGLGVSNDERGTDEHQIDNDGWTDYIILQFDKIVSVSSLGIYGYGDTDLTWAVGTTATSFDGTLSFNNFAALDSAFDPFNTSNVDPYSYGLVSRPVNGSALTGNLFLVAASTSSSNDYFKLNGLTANVAAVPEPATWAMMMMGLGLAGAMMRRSKANTAVSFA